ncbi:spore coat protein U domain-containing protein [Variovorax saccharolyticus]|uniref:spore coat protein U domain-containing protein n=1 Tax=Variovorax saccharolyticus TaxID=3053516 RepID=UPI002575042D|nr:spore coat protein U domain-containing protein [Variovorax sp. J31P216]MDM0030206.1 spore coat protein U domain-containing protein [Variovorax sp. J31P216]
MRGLAVGWMVAAVSCGTWAVECTVSATSVAPSTLYVNGAASYATGSITATCTRQTGDVSRPYIYIGVNQGEPPSGRAMTRQNGTTTLAYEIYHRTYGSGAWTEGAGVAATSTSSGGVFYRMANSAAPQTTTFTYYIVIPSATSKPAGIYDDLAVTATVRLSTSGGSNTGATLALANWGIAASIQHSCYFSSTPAPVVINYTSFMSAAATATSFFQVSCTYQTPYTLAIAAPSTGTLLGINYSLSLGASSGTGSGLAQTYSIIGSAAGSQAGTCGAGTCSASRVHTINVVF